MSVEPQAEFFPELVLLKSVYQPVPDRIEAWGKLVDAHGELVDVTLASFLSGRSAGSVRSAMAAGRLTRVDFGGSILVPLAEVLAFSRVPKFSRGGFSGIQKGRIIPAAVPDSVGVSDGSSRQFSTGLEVGPVVILPTLGGGNITTLIHQKP